MPILAESGAIDDIEYPEAEARTCDENPTGKTVNALRFPGGIVRRDDAQGCGTADIDELKAARVVGEKNFLPKESGALEIHLMPLI
jgi:hypothetical protein